MDLNHDEESQPVSPTGQYFNSSVLSVCVLGVLEFEVPIQEDDSLTLKLLKDVFLPINPRFSSIMVWKSTPKIALSVFLYPCFEFLFLVGGIRGTNAIYLCCSIINWTICSGYLVKCHSPVANKLIDNGSIWIAFLFKLFFILQHFL